MEKLGQKFEIVIIGAGFVGLSQAIALSKQGFKVAILDKYPITTQLDKINDGRGSAISYFSYEFFTKLGVWQKIAKDVEPIKDIKVYDTDSPVFLHFDPSHIEQDKFGFIVENPILRKALSQAVLEDSNITNLAPSTIENIDYEDQTIKLSDKEVSFDLLLGIDGKNSFTRKLAGIEFTHKEYEQTALVFSVKHSKPHYGLAHEKFTPNGPFAILPMTKNRSNIVWTEASTTANLLHKKGEEFVLAKLQEELKDLLGEVSLASKVFKYPLSLTQAKNYYGNNMALVGDAAHSIHPIAGQGFNLGVRDISKLTEILTNAKSTGLKINSKTILAEYEQAAKKHNKFMVLATDNLNRLFSNNSKAARHIRNFGLNIVSHSRPLKKFFMSFASGKYNS